MKRPKRSTNGVATALVVITDLCFFGLLFVGGPQLVLGAIIAALTLVSAVFLGWIPLPGDKRR
jgi:hypothetical protein